MTPETTREPVGTLLLRTLAMPADTNPSGDIFGGWLMSQMDMAGAIHAYELAEGRVVTVAVDAITFLRPVAVGDVVCCYGHCSHVGRSSIKVKMEVWVKKVITGSVGERYCVTEATYTYVAVDAQGKSRAVPRENNPLLDESLAALATVAVAEGQAYKS
ncbi:acyl-CoA thioester hydrolase YciA [Uliginosibacterium gangwonense]|uniref:acyl-CoA thioester hydrolase YciA n=1 Tax=Uliginosibacterium gangwonense TaxID=392736 RepID=UPI0003A7041F|nr:acyl-CoA thioester hydrolase YciA [Uliginosibacterium gangwonense]